MKAEEESLLRMADESLEAARVLTERNLARFAVSRAYYSMFYCAEALLLARKWSFSKHSGVIAAFGREFTKAGLLPEEMHRHLIEAAELREDGDYDFAIEIDAAACAEQLTRAERFIALTRKYLEEHHGP